MDGREMGGVRWKAELCQLTARGRSNLKDCQLSKVRERCTKWRDTQRQLSRAARLWKRRLSGEHFCPLTGVRGTQLGVLEEEDMCSSPRIFGGPDMDMDLDARSSSPALMRAAPRANSTSSFKSLLQGGALKRSAYLQTENVHPVPRLGSYGASPRPGTDPSCQKFGRMAYDCLPALTTPFQTPRSAHSQSPLLTPCPNTPLVTTPVSCRGGKLREYGASASALLARLAGSEGKARSAAQLHSFVQAEEMPSPDARFGRAPRALRPPPLALPCGTLVQHPHVFPFEEHTSTVYQEAEHGYLSPPSAPRRRGSLDIWR